jgi:hypothetical protein
MVPYRIAMSVSSSLATMLLVVVIVAVSATGCCQRTEHIDEKGGLVMSDTSDRLPDITLIDQHGQKVSLSSLKGKPVLFDFIYTTCPGPCLLLTSRMKAIATQLGPALGKEARRARELAEREIILHAREYDEKEIFPRDVCQEVFKAGLMNLAVPKDIGGPGLVRQSPVTI